MKFAKTYSLIVGRDWYRIPYSPNSIAHLTSRPYMSSLWRICRRGWFVSTTTWWIWKYNFSLVRRSPKLGPFFPLPSIFLNIMECLAWIINWALYAFFFSYQDDINFLVRNPKIEEYTFSFFWLWPDHRREEISFELFTSFLTL
jgi:hypothetical protein